MSTQQVHAVGRVGLIIGNFTQIYLKKDTGRCQDLVFLKNKYFSPDFWLEILFSPSVVNSLCDSTLYDLINNVPSLQYEWVHLLLLPSSDQLNIFWGLLLCQYGVVITINVVVVVVTTRLVLLSLLINNSRKPSILPLPDSSPYQPPNHHHNQSLIRLFQEPPAGQSQPTPSGCICGCRRAGGRRWRRPGWGASCGAGGGQPRHFPVLHFSDCVKESWKGKKLESWTALWRWC